MTRKQVLDLRAAKSGTRVVPDWHPIGAGKDESSSKNTGCGTKTRENGTGGRGNDER